MNTPSSAQQKASFGTQPFFFGRYYIMNIIVWCAATVGVLYWNKLFENISLWWLLSLTPLFLTRVRYIIVGAVVLSIIVLSLYAPEITWLTGVLFIIAIYVGHLSAVFIHNAAHLIFKPRWINTIIGEICALHQLSAGLLVWRYVHSQHHAFPDDPNKDPHPPMSLSFWEFVDSARALVGKRLERMYLSNWGDTEESRKRWRQQNGLMLFSRFAKTTFIFSFLGPKWFVLIYLPSYITNVVFFAAFNYYTHRPQPDGTVAILNLSGNLYYDFCNRFLFGVMYHKNHHLKPRAFNPMKVDVDSQTA